MLWTVVILASAFDVVTTMAGVTRGATEANVVARAFFETYGTPGIGLLKFSVLVLVVALWANLPDRYATAVLSAFAVVSLIVVGINAFTLTTL